LPALNDLSLAREKNTQRQWRKRIRAESSREDTLKREAILRVIFSFDYLNYAWEGETLLCIITELLLDGLNDCNFFFIQHFDGGWDWWVEFFVNRFEQESRGKFVTDLAEIAFIQTANLVTGRRSDADEPVYQREQ
jgi:hypothetical protein